MKLSELLMEHPLCNGDELEHITDAEVSAPFAATARAIIASLYRLNGLSYAEGLLKFEGWTDSEVAEPEEVTIIIAID